jgi:hypothetical protein
MELLMVDVGWDADQATSTVVGHGAPFYFNWSPLDNDARIIAHVSGRLRRTLKRNCYLSFFADWIEDCVSSLQTICSSIEHSAN